MNSKVRNERPVFSFSFSCIVQRLCNAGRHDVTKGSIFFCEIWFFCVEKKRFLFLTKNKCNIAFSM